MSNMAEDIHEALLSRERAIEGLRREVIQYKEALENAINMQNAGKPVGSANK